MDPLLVQKELVQITEVSPSYIKIMITNTFLMKVDILVELCLELVKRTHWES